MQETWDISALIDKGVRIHEARGMTMHHLGMELGQIANHAFIDFVTPSQRAWFRRRMAKIAAGEELGIITAELETGAVAPQPLFVAARPASVAGKWRLMLTANLPEGLKPRARPPGKPALASGHEFMLLAESAAQQAGERLDPMRLNAAIPADDATASPQARAELQAEFDEIVMGSAFEGIASRTGTGEYLLMRDRKVSADALLEKLGAAAELRAIRQAQLGLATNSLQLSSLGANLSAAGIRWAVSNLRQPDGPAWEWEGVVTRRPLRLRPGVLAAGLAVIVAIGWPLI
ncbi:MAG: hypothetical protein ACREEP_09205 [Dongiaceae bacterium]